MGPTIANWIHALAHAQDDFEVKLVDIAAFRLPVFDEPEHPRLQRYQHAHTRDWSASVDQADAFVFVMPEYNYGPPGSLVNAMNYLVREWQYKAASFVSYGGISGGIRGVQMTKQLLTTLKVVPIPEAVIIPNFPQHMGAEGAFEPNNFHLDSAKSMLEELSRWTDALKQLRPIPLVIV